MGSFGENVSYLQLEYCLSSVTLSFIPMKHSYLGNLMIILAKYYINKRKWLSKVQLQKHFKEQDFKIYLASLEKLKIYNHFLPKQSDYSKLQS